MTDRGNAFTGENCDFKQNWRTVPCLTPQDTAAMKTEETTAQPATQPATYRTQQKTYPLHRYLTREGPR